MGGGHSPEAGPAPERMIGAVGVAEPPSFSMVMPKALAGTPTGSGGKTTLALPASSGRKRPAGMGAEPLAGITQSSYVLSSARRARLLPWKMRPPRAGR